MSVWQKFQRIGKKALKYELTASFQEATINSSGSHQVTKVIIQLIRRNRQYKTQTVTTKKFHSSTFVALWNVPENIQFTTTLYRDKVKHEYEPKYWTIQVVDVSDATKPNGRILAYKNLNVVTAVGLVTDQVPLRLTMKVSSKKIASCIVLLTVSSLLLKEGDAMDDDMISVGSCGLPEGPWSAFDRTSALRVSQMSHYSSMSCGSYGTDSPNASTHSDRSEAADEFAKVVKDFGTLASSGRPSSSPKQSPESHPRSLEHTSPMSPNESRHSFEVTSKPALVDNDLLMWLQRVLDKKLPSKPIDFNTSFQDGVIFCSLVSHYRPDLIRTADVSHSKVKENFNQLKRATDQLGIANVFNATSMSLAKSSDPLLIATFLYHLKAVLQDGNKSSFGDIPNPTKPRNMSTQSPSKDSQEKQIKKSLFKMNADGLIKEDLPLLRGLMKKHTFSKSSEHKGRLPRRSRYSDVALTDYSSDIEGRDNYLQPQYRGLILDQLNSSNEYIRTQTEALEREQEKINLEAELLEPQARAAIGTQEQTAVMKAWFDLINRNNALIRQNMKLRILEKEERLKSQYHCVQEELRKYIALEDWNKTKEMKEYEEKLIQKLIEVINQRDTVVQELDMREKVLQEETEAYEQIFSFENSSRGKNQQCVIQ